MTMAGEWLIQEYVYGNGRGVIWDTISEFSFKLIKISHEIWFTSRNMNLELSE
jgi:hypothetical protein